MHAHPFDSGTSPADLQRPLDKLPSHSASMRFDEEHGDVVESLELNHARKTAGLLRHEHGTAGLAALRHRIGSSESEELVDAFRRKIARQELVEDPGHK